MKVRGKMQLCVCENYKKYFKSIQGRANYTLFERYKDLENVVNKHVDAECRHFLAQPELDNDNIQWFAQPYTEKPNRLSELNGQKYDDYKKVKEETLSHYRNVVEKLKEGHREAEAEVLEKAIKFVNDDFVYCYDGKTVLGIWGMELRDEVRDPVGIAMKNDFDKPKKQKLVPDVDRDEETDEEEDIEENEDEIDEDEDEEKDDDDDKTPLKVRFIDGGNGVLQGQTEYEKKYKELVYSGEIPEVVPKEGFRFAGWDKNPVNYVVQEDTVFTALYEEFEKDKSLKVRFFGGEHGTLRGQTEYEKKYGEQVSPREIPEVVPNEGCRFVGWDKNPVNYVVREDTEFTALYEKEKEDDDSKWNRFWGWGSGCLNWLLTLLLLALIGLLLWYLLGKHNLNFCGCDCGCNEVVVVPDHPITPKPEPVKIDTIHENEDLPEPTENCGVHFSGWYLSDKNKYPWRDCSKIFEKEDYGEYVGQGYYPDNTKILPKSMSHSFDALAVKKGTRLIIYSEPDFKGRVVLDVTGPVLIENVKAKGRYDELLTYTFSDELQNMFPPERRQWSSENMHDWAKGSCKIIGEQYDEY